MLEAGELKSLARTALERVLGLLPERGSVDWAEVRAARWRVDALGGRLEAHADLDDIRLDDLKHIDDQKEKLSANTRRFVAGYPANNVLLWGARGTGKSSLVHAMLNEHAASSLRLIEVDKLALKALPEIASVVRKAPYRFIVFCDDLSFEADDASYKELKSMLEGSIFRASDNVLIYATSNRRHLIPEYMAENQAARVEEGELHHGEAVEEKVSLSDRFGLWLSFYPFRQDAYLQVVAHWLARLGERHGVEAGLTDDARKEALSWALARGARNGRTAQYFARHWVGRLLETPAKE